MKNKLWTIFVILSVIIACDSDDEFVGQTFIQLDLKNGKRVNFESEQCEFDNLANSRSYNFTETDLSGKPIGQAFISSHSNILTTENDTTAVIVWLGVKYLESQDQHDIDILKQEFTDEMSFLKGSNTPLNFRIDIGKQKFNNGYLTGGSNSDSNEYFNMELIDYKVDYSNNCDNSRLLYLDLSVNGMLYEFERGERIDSICIETGKVNLIFDIE